MPEICALEPSPRVTKLNFARDKSRKNALLAGDDALNDTVQRALISSGDWELRRLALSRYGYYAIASW